MLVSNAVEGFLQDSRIGLAARTVHNYQYNLERLQEFLFARLVDQLEHLTDHHLRDYLAYYSSQPMQKRGRQRPASAATLHQVYRVIRCWLNWCVRHGWLPANPILNVRQPKLPRPVARHISLSAVRDLLDAAASTKNPVRDTALVLLCLDTGLRRQEVAGLQLADVDLPGRRLTVRLSKGNRGRMVPFTSTTAHAVATWLVGRAATLGKSLFGLKPQGVYQLLRRLRVLADLPELSPHMLRHTMATYYGGDIYDLAKILGHRDIKVTAETYAHRDVERLAHQHDRLSIIRHVTVPEETPIR